MTEDECTRFEECFECPDKERCPDAPKVCPSCGSEMAYEGGFSRIENPTYERYICKCGHEEKVTDGGA